MIRNGKQGWTGNSQLFLCQMLLLYLFYLCTNGIIKDYKMCACEPINTPSLFLLYTLAGILAEVEYRLSQMASYG